MENLENCTEKLCSFYVSDWHLVTMILPYINNELNEKANITTILENDIEENIKILISKLNLKNEKEILNIDWKKCEEIKYSKINKKLKKDINIIIVSGSEDYINSVNKNVEKWIIKNLINNKIKIINCYEVTDFNNNIKEILYTHKKVLNTSGEKNIEDVFVGYNKKMA